MSGRATNAQAFRPAPFPVYAPNSRPALIAATRKLVALLFALALLAPFTVDIGRAASGRVEVAQVTLDAREPVQLSCDFSLAGFTACPPRLGIFTDDHQFLCSGEVPQGILYGTCGASRRVIILSYNQDAQPDVDGLLAQIRKRVDQMNDRANLLRQAKAAMGPPPAEQTGLPAWFWDPEPAPTQSSVFDKLAAGLPSDLADGENVERRLAARAQDTARLKQIYYSAQEARIDLLAAQFNLQLALAQSPGQEVPGMLVLGGSDAARDAMLTEIGRLSDAWSSRLNQLESQSARDRAWLEAESTPPPDSGWGVFSFIPNLLGQGSEQTERPLEPSVQPGPPARRLEQSYRESRLVVADAETSSISAGLGKLETLKKLVELGIPAAGTFRNVALASRAFSPPALEDLPRYSTVTEMVSAGDADQLLEQLAGQFAGTAANQGHSAAAGGSPEVLYCLAAAELVAQLKPDYAVPQAASESGSADQPEHQVTLAYTGFMQFAGWCISSDDALVARAEPGVQSSLITQSQ